MRKLTRDDVESYVYQLGYVQPIPPQQLIATHLAGGVSAGIGVAALAVSAVLYASVYDIFFAVSYLAVAVVGALLGIISDIGLRRHVEPRRGALLCWLGSAIAAAATYFIPLIGAGFLTMLLISAVTMHTRAGIDQVVITSGALMRWAQWIAVVFGINIPLATVLVLFAVVDGSHVSDLAIASSLILSGFTAVLAATAIVSQPPSPRFLLSHGKIQAAVVALIRGGRAKRASCADESVRILIRESLRELSQRRRIPTASLPQLHRGYACAAIVGTGGAATWALLSPLVLASAGASITLTLQFVIAGFIGGCVILGLVPAFSALVESLHETLFVTAALANALVLAGGAVLTAVGATTFGGLILLVTVAVSIVLNVAVIVPDCIVTIRRMVPSFRLRRVRTVLYAVQLGLVALSLVALGLRVPVAVPALIAVCQFGAVSLYFATGRRVVVAVDFTADTTRRLD